MQFQSIVETFTPHETVFSFKSASELTEQTLASACMLQASVGSLTSDSSSSLRRQRLGGITEDAEEGAQVPNSAKTISATSESSSLKPGLNDGRLHETTQESPTVKSLENKSSETKPESSEPKALESESKTSPVKYGRSGIVLASRPPPVEMKLPKQEEVAASSHLNTPPLRTDSLPQSRALSPVLSQNDPPSAHLSLGDRPSTPKSATSAIDKPLPVPPQATPPRSKPEEQRTSTATPKHSFHPSLPANLREPEEVGPEPRQSSQSTRPPSERKNSYSGFDYLYKPKQKLGPRPHVEPEKGPTTSGPNSKARQLIANLPSGVKAAPRVATSDSHDRPSSQHSSKSVPNNFRHRSHLAAAPPPPLPPFAPQILNPYQPSQEQPPSQQYQNSQPYPKSQPYQASQPESLSRSQAGLTIAGASTVTPEKLRLMKALQMRKKQQALAKRISTAVPTPAIEPMKHTTSAEAMDKAMQKDGVQESSKCDHTEHKQDSAIQMMVPSDFQEAQKTDYRNEATGETTAREETTAAEPERKSVAVTAIQEADVSSEENPEPMRPGHSRTESDLHNTQVALYMKQEELKETQAHENLLNADHPNVQSPVVEAVKVKVAPAEHTHIPMPVDEKQSPVIEQAQPRPTLSRKSTTEPKDRRRGLLETIKVLSSPEGSDGSDDESFIDEDELQNATLEEAKPMTVAKSPIMPIFSKSTLERSTEAHSRTVSSPLAKADELPKTPEKPKSSGGRSIGSRSFGSRSASTALPQLPQWPPMPDHGNAPLAKKGPLSTGISSRIKALEVFSRRESGSTSPETPKAKPSAFSAIKKRTSQAQGKNTPNTSTALPPPRQLPSPEPTPPAEQLAPRPWLQRNGSDTQVGAPMQQGESVSVTARIIRNPEEKLANGVSDAAGLSTMNLQHSVLTVEHARAEPSAQRPATSREISAAHLDSRPGSPREAKPRFSFSSHRSNRTSMPRLPTSGSMASRMSQSSSQNKGLSGNLSPSSSDAWLDNDDKPKESRASRLLKRMSNLTGTSRNKLSTSMSPKKENVQPLSIAEMTESPTEESIRSESISHVVDIGDVNVQFPDTLLWKRRFMRIDDQGYLVLTPPIKETMEKSRGVSRKFHLSEFKKPTLPDPEREELPWSILLDFEDGSCLQCACESRYTQAQVLRSELLF